MLDHRITLLHISSRYIVEFLRANPLPAGVPRGRPSDWAGKGSHGDWCPPEPAILVFLLMLRQNNGLFVWQDYVATCKERWIAEWKMRSQDEQYGMEVRLWSQFYMSMIDSLHVWALFAELGWYDICYLDSMEDATGHSDLTVIRHGQATGIALRADTIKSRAAWEHKKKYRGASEDTAMALWLPMNREKAPGNKRWYNVGDLESFRPRSDIVQSTFAF